MHLHVDFATCFGNPIYLVIQYSLFREDATIRCLEVELKQLKEYVEAPGNCRMVAKYAESSWNKLQELFYKV